MKKLLLALAVTALPLLAQAEDWKNVALLDTRCHQQGADADVSAHPTQCLLKCADSGYGLIDSHGKWSALDKRGNALVLAALKSTKKTADIRVNVTGERKGDTIAVSKLALAD